MAVAYLPMIVIGIMVVGWLLWMLVFQKKFAAKYAAAAGEAQKKFDENKDALIGGYLSDDEKYGILQKAVGDEKIVGIASYAEPKSLGKSMTEGLKTAITNVKKVNMDQWFMVVTEGNLHLIETNGENVVDHAVLDLSQMKNVACSRASSLNIKNLAQGVEGNSLNTMKFTYKDTDHSYNLYKTIFYYPKFTVRKNTDGQYYREYPGIKANRNKMSDPETQMEMMCESHFYNGFKQAMADRFKVNVPQ